MDGKQGRVLMLFYHAIVAIAHTSAEARTQPCARAFATPTTERSALQEPLAPHATPCNCPGWHE